MTLPCRAFGSRSCAKSWFAFELSPGCAPAEVPPLLVSVGELPPLRWRIRRRFREGCGRRGRGCARTKGSRDSYERTRRAIQNQTTQETPEAARKASCGEDHVMPSHPAWVQKIPTEWNMQL